MIDFIPEYTYLPYGQHSQQGSSFDNPFTYVGAHGVMDEGNGYFYMKNRYYDALSRHFLQRDPIGFGGGINLYLYSGANPVNYIDPEGTFFNIAYMYKIKRKVLKKTKDGAKLLAIIMTKWQPGLQPTRKRKSKRTLTREITATIHI